MYMQLPNAYTYKLRLYTHYTNVVCVRGCAQKKLPFMGGLTADDNYHSALSDLSKHRLKTPSLIIVLASDV